MSNMTSIEKDTHLQAIADALPPELRLRVDKRYDEIRVGPSTVEFDFDWYSNVARLKLSFESSVMLDIDDAKTRLWKQRVRDDKFCYDRIAGHIANVINQHDAAKARREKGESIAMTRGRAIQDVFNRDPLLGALDLHIRTTPTSRTEIGTVDIDIRGKDHEGSEASLCYDGKVFNGKIDVEDLSAEQVTAMMVVCRLNKLNVLDLLALCDDSILGPSIRALTEKLDDA